MYGGSMSLAKPVGGPGSHFSDNGHWRALPSWSFQAQTGRRPSCVWWWRAASTPSLPPSLPLRARWAPVKSLGPGRAVGAPGADGNRPRGQQAQARLARPAGLGHGAHRRRRDA